MSENKLSKKYIGTDQVGSSQLELENNSSLRSKNSLGVSLDVLKVDGSNNLQILQSPFLPGDAVSALQAVPKQQVDAAISGLQDQITPIATDVSVLIGQVSTLQSDVSDLIAADIALDLRLDTAESNITTLQGEMTTAQANILALQTYSENIVHIDTVSGVDAAGRGSIMQPYKTITYAYSQVPSAASNINQWCLEKLILKVAPGDYTENVELGLKRARTAIMGEGVYINGTVTQTWLVADIPYSGTPSAPINGAALPAPYTNFAAPTFELIGFGGGMEGGYVSKNLMVQGLVKIATIPWATNSSWQSAGTLSAFFFTNHVQLRGGFNVCHDLATYPASIGAAVTCELNSSSIEGGFLGVAPFTAGQQLTASDNNCVCNLKAHNSQLKSTLGPRISIAEIDGCRIVNMDRTMGATVTNGSITGQNSSSFSGIVNSPFAGTVYKIGRSVGVTAVAFKMDANSYADLQTKTIDAGTAPITYNLIDKASGVAVVDPATNYTRTANNVESSLEGIDVALGTYLLLSGTRTMTGALNMGSFKIGSLADPTLAQDAATKAYVDAQISAGVDYEVQKVVLSASDITNQYVDLSFKAALASIVSSSDRVNLIITLSADSDADFIQDNSGAVTRLTFQGDSASGGGSPLSDGQIIYFNYVKSL
jgi:hypothetical protein